MTTPTLEIIERERRLLTLWLSEQRVQALPSGFPVEAHFADTGSSLRVRTAEYRPVNDSTLAIPQGYRERDLRQRQRHR